MMYRLKHWTQRWMKWTQRWQRCITFFQRHSVAVLPNTYVINVLDVDLCLY